MSTVINTNMASLLAQNNLSNSQSALATSVQALSSGLRISSAKDDATGLAVSQKLTAQIKTVGQAVQNANNAISMLQTADGAMNDVSNMLQRMKQLATQANDATLSSDQRTFIGNELNSLQAEINKVATRTTFNGRGLLDGTQNSQVSLAATGSNGTLLGTGTSAAVGANGTLNNVVINPAVAKSGTFTISFNQSSPSAPTSITLTRNDGTAQTLSLNTSAGAFTPNGTTTFNFDQLGVKFDLTSGATAVAATDLNGTSGISGKTIITSTSSSQPIFQVGASTSDTLTIDAFKNIAISGSNGAAGDANGYVDLNTALANFSALTSSSTNTDVNTAANNLSNAIDKVITTVSAQRADLGSTQNRLNYNISNLQSQSNNLTQANSRIVDTDYAAQTAQLTKTQIMQQAATAMLAQANQMPNVVLSLLK